MCNHNTNTDKKFGTSAHDLEHKKWNRRSFLQALGLSGAGTMMLGGMPLSASSNSKLAAAISNSETDRVLVIIRLKGGNDGLNTIVPIYDYDTYATQRPSIRHYQNQLTALTPDFGMPSYMNDLLNLWDNGGMKVVHGVGYENPSLSHFAGADVWASTDPTNATQSGWLGRHFEELYPEYLLNPPSIPAAVQIGSIGNLIFDGPSNSYAFSVANPDQLESIAENGTVHDMTSFPDCIYGEQLEFMRGTTNTTYQYAGTIHEAYSEGSNSFEYMDSDLGQQLAIVAKLIKGNLGTKVYMVTLDGFDTHANQVNNHRELLVDLSNSIKTFYDDLAQSGYDDKVLSMTLSEFGRRIYENGSNGTDHGKAAPLMLFGPALQGNGFVGTHPDLSTGGGNLDYTQDFREVYASIMQEWLCIDSDLVDEALLNTTYARVDLGFNCDTLGVDDFNRNRFKHYVLYTDTDSILKIKNPYTQHTVIKLYDIMGRDLAILKNEILFAGEHSISIKNTVNTKLNVGQYIYRISIGNQNFSKSLIIR
ncbi:DUF1501 domain-containing protein [Winogradskyella sp. PG-2]|uniref:DUF1501 domain-containing protein n=1 Tax=Winogradskyella sp. PG-2 TaxID=754409 RepID=UPI0004587C97|nr:DUF1501 domain-containing protein [Winogradskyella sp. PG-2]BAO75751.1 twin-arginine translocation pathway signal precursor [Winogradskyella sp. PG-2]